MVTLICEVCHDKFDVYPSWAKFRKTCSRACAAELKSLTMRGENHHNYGKIFPRREHTEESKEKMRESKIGERNPQFGKPSWNAGKTTSEETRKKQSEAKVGKSPWNKGKKFTQIAEENNPNWRGGVTSTNERIRKSLEYKEWRENVFARDDFTCMNCGTRGGNLEADHIKPFSSFPKLRLSVDNGRTLCSECHRQTDTYGRKALSWRPDIS